MREEDEVRERPAEDSDHGTPGIHRDDVDESLIRWMLSLSPRDRLEFLQAHLDALEVTKTAIRRL